MYYGMHVSSDNDKLWLNFDIVLSRKITLKKIIIILSWHVKNMWQKKFKKTSNVYVNWNVREESFVFEPPRCAGCVRDKTSIVHFFFTLFFLTAALANSSRCYSIIIVVQIGNTVTGSTVRPRVPALRSCLHFDRGHRLVQYAHRPRARTVQTVFPTALALLERLRRLQHFRVLPYEVRHLERL